MIHASVRTLTHLFSQAAEEAAPWLFFRELLSHPAGVGAVWPSSRALARQMAAHVPAGGDGLIVELGGGTGVVTQALLNRGIDAGRLIVVERSSTFVRHLRARFPQIRVVQGDAAELDRLLPDGPHLDAIVSSLPLRSLPSTERLAILDQWCHLLPTEGMAVQFTYDLRHTGHMAMFGLKEREHDTVWTNIPPARIVVFGNGKSLAADPPAIEPCPD